MKVLTTMTAVAALIAGMSIANAQSAQTNPPPSSLNAGTQTNTAGSKSGAESKATAIQSSGRSKETVTTGMGATSNVSPASPNAGEKPAK